MPLRRPNSAPSPGRGAMLWKVGPADKVQSTMNKMNAEGDGEVGYTVGRDGLVTADGDECSPDRYGRNKVACDCNQSVNQ